MESGERLRPGDLAITTDPQAGTPLIGKDVIVQIVGVEYGNSTCYGVYKFPFDTEPEPRAVAPEWVKLYWRMDATA